MKLPLANGKYRRPAAIISKLLLFSALAVWFFHFYVWYQYDGTRPSAPDVASGRVLAQNSHGHVVYLTVEEKNRLRNIVVAAGLLLVTGILVGTLFAPDAVWKKPPKPWEVRRW
jgi:hypothetical protein